MPIASCLGYLQGLLDGLTMPENCPAMNAFVIPPDPNIQTQIPSAYVWPSRGREQRNLRGGGGTVPRNLGPNSAAGAGHKTIVHSADVFIVWMGANDDPLFPSIVDFAMAALRTAYPMPVLVTDQYTGNQTQLTDIGETQDYRVVVSALADEAFNRYDALLTVQVTEEMIA
ncbi:MAG TPA: hypothetical protein VFY14_17450 [Streptomyces sp.]|nr:hypothetical protein [Streptomyces sp.]